MSYDALKAEMGRTPVAIVEIYLDQCSLTYGVAPCTAAVGVSGTRKCFNTVGTCQDRVNYDKSATAKVYRFASVRIDALQEAGDPPTFPTLVSVDTAPTRLEPGKGLGIRSTLSVTIQDHPWTDEGIDPYPEDRAVDFDSKGTLWSRLLARNFNYENRRIDVLTGYLEEDGSYSASNFVRRTYLLYRISGPDDSGKIVIEAKDPLKAADSEKAVWPLPSKASLSAAMDAADLTLQLADAEGYVASNFAAGQAYIRIEDEVMLVTSVTDDGGGFYTVEVDRATLPSFYDQSYAVAVDHKVNATVQPCWFFDEERVDTVIYKLLSDGSSIPNAYLPLASWALEIGVAGLDAYTMSAIISTPTSVRDLLIELTRHNILLWWDERDQQVKLRGVILSANPERTLSDEDSLVAGSVNVTKDVAGRVSQVWVFYGHRYPTLDTKDPANFASVRVVADQDTESEDEYGQQSIERIFSRWLVTSQSAIAGEICNRLLRNYKHTKTVVGWVLDPKDDDIWTGDAVSLLHHKLVDDVGEPLATSVRVLEVEEILTQEGPLYRFMGHSENGLGRSGVIAPDLYNNTVLYDGAEVYSNGQLVVYGTSTTFPDYPDASEAQRGRYVFIAPDSEVFDDGTQAYQIQ